MLEAFRKWMFGRAPSPKYGGVYMPTVLPGDPANMAAQAAASTAYNLDYAQEMNMLRPQQTDAIKRKLAEDNADYQRRRRRREEESSSSSSLGTSLATDTAISTDWSSSSDSSSSWSSDSSSSGSDFSGGGGSFGGGGSDGSW